MDGTSVGSEDTFEAVARTETTFILNQAAWLAAFARGLADSAPRASQRLEEQADRYVQEAAASA